MAVPGAAVPADAHELVLGGTGASNPGGRSRTFEAAEEVCQHVTDVSGRRRRLRTGHAWLARRQVLVGRFTDTGQRYPHLRSAALVLNRLRNPVVVGRRLSERERVVYVGDRLENARPLESLDIELLTLEVPHHQFGLVAHEGDRVGRRLGS